VPGIRCDRQSTGDDLEDKLSWWGQWLKQPQALWIHKVSFQVHFWIGAMAGAYLALMSVTGSIVVYRDELSRWPFVERIVRLHANLLLGLTGRFVNGIGGICLTLLCMTGAIIWWPGVKNWRRSLTVSWKAQFPRINWDLHRALGYWCFFFVLLWGVSGIYFSFPQWFNALLLIDSADRFTDQGLFWLSALHFGRFDWFTKVVWAVLGLVPAILAFTGTFICCRRVIYKMPSNPNR
jgi:uncharacterized iron-regulated membrane protein